MTPVPPAPARELREPGGSTAPWRAVWVEAVPTADAPRRPQRLRRSVVLPKDVTSAVVRVSARGSWSLFVNDDRVDAAALSPEPRNDGLVAWHRFDVTSRLRAGENVLGLIVGSAWETGRAVDGSERPPLALLLELDVELPGGDHLLVGSDGEFRSKPGAIVSSADAPGEVQDHRLREAGWKLPGYDDSAWTPVRVSADQGLERLAFEQAETTRIEAEVEAASVRETSAGILRVEFPRRVRGRGKAAFAEAAGTRVTVEYRLADSSTGPADAFIAAGSPHELFEPGFAFHEFDHLLVSGLRNPGSAHFTALEFSRPR